MKIGLDQLSGNPRGELVCIPYRHTMENVGKTELLAVRVEIKQTPARP